MLEYIIKSALLLSVLYGSFALMLSRETFHRFNRLALLSVLVASMVLPLIEIEAPSTLSLWGNASEPLTYIQTLRFGEKEMPLQTLQSDEEEVLPLASLSSENAALPQRGSGEGALYPLYILYLIGFLAALTAFVVQLFRLWREMKGGVRTTDGQGNTVVIRGGNFAPFVSYII